MLVLLAIFQWVKCKCFRHAGFRAHNPAGHQTLMDFLFQRFFYFFSQTCHVSQKWTIFLTLPTHAFVMKIIPVVNGIKKDLSSEIKVIGNLQKLLAIDLNVCRRTILCVGGFRTKENLAKQLYNWGICVQKRACLQKRLCTCCLLENLLKVCMQMQKAHRVQNSNCIQKVQIMSAWNTVCRPHVA